MDNLLLELRKAYGPSAEFREGQREAIEGVLVGKRSLVVQKTGWGKSLVYFLATKLLRQRHVGLTIIISPLLALMNNQIEAAEKLGLTVETINSENMDNKDSIIENLKANKVDALIISPERLANDEFKELLVNHLSGRVLLFVVDEAHCISDWGHDFRPDYRRIVEIVQRLPSSIPVLATTATANDRVIEDIKKQLGDNLLISRGSLVRESLAVQVIQLRTKEERLAWLSNNISNLPGTGIIYCLTIRDCQLVRDWLSEQQINCECYYSNIDKKEEKNKAEIVEKFMNNTYKVLVATVAFGMGFDKPDIGFVVHFQKPANLVSYYQQIGRAGRAIDYSFAIMLVGEEDDRINQYFIDSAFPTERTMNDVVHAIQTSDGIRECDIERKVNMKKTKIEACLKYLCVNGDIYKEKSFYHKSAKKWIPDLERSKEVTEKRYKELEEMKTYVHTNKCYMEFVAKVLDDSHAIQCGKCSNCLGIDLVPTEVKYEDIEMVKQFVNSRINIIEPRKVWPTSARVDGKYKIDEKFRCQEGLVLSNYGDAGRGKLVSDGKYVDNYFSDELVEASYERLKEFIIDKQITWVTSVPSLRRPHLVGEFAQRLAARLNLNYVTAIVKVRDVQSQKELNNSYQQFNNANESFDVNSNVIQGQNVLLVDDMVDSKWTFTVCGYKLLRSGSGEVFPYALANSASRNGDE